MSDFGESGRVDLDALQERVLNAARNEHPSPELSARMARGLGLTGVLPALPTEGAPGAGGSAATGVKEAPSTGQVAGSAGKAGSITGGGGSAGSTASALTWRAGAPWLSGAVVAAALVGIAVSRATGGDESVPPPPPAAATERPDEPALQRQETEPALQRQETEPALQRQETEPAPAPPSVTPQPAAMPTQAQRAKSPAPVQPGKPRPPADDSTISDEIATVDATRTAVRSGEAGRGLQLAQQYLQAYPQGSFRPEARALEIEALVLLGRRSEARTLAERHFAGQRGTPLGRRVARVVGLEPPP